MDYVVEETNDAFIYNDSRFFSRMYVGLKCIGVIVYAGTLTSCAVESLYFYMSMICVMFMSAVNSARYEYCHYKRYGTSFYSAEEFDIWKSGLYPKSRIFFSVTEFLIKLGYFVYIFPPEFDFINRCASGESIFKLHILALTLTYVLSGGVFAFLLLYFYCCNSSRDMVICVIPVMTPIQTQNLIQNQSQYECECCICLERASESTMAWSMLVCGHKFHTECVSAWLVHHKTCPICRTSYEV